MKYRMKFKELDLLTAQSLLARDRYGTNNACNIIDIELRKKALYLNIPRVIKS